MHGNFRRAPPSPPLSLFLCVVSCLVVVFGPILFRVDSYSFCSCSSEVRGDETKKNRWKQTQECSYPLCGVSRRVLAGEGERRNCCTVVETSRGCVDRRNMCALKKCMAIELATSSGEQAVHVAPTHAQTGEELMWAGLRGPDPG